MIINISNQLTQQEGLQQTYSSGTIGAGATSIPVKNVAGFTNQWAIQLGQTGQETAEILLISGNPAGGVSLGFGTSPAHTGGTAFYAHAIDTPIYQVHYDQIILYRSTAGTGGAFSALGTYSLTPDNTYTQIDDSTGLSTYAYYAQYYNSVSGDTSGSSSVFVPGGPTYYSLQKLRQRVKDKLYSWGFIKDDTVIDDWINEWYELMTNAAIKVNQNYLLGTAQYAFGTAGLGTVTASTFKQPVKVEVTYDGQVFIKSTQIQVNEFSEIDFFSAYSPRHAWQGENVFEILPHNSPGTARITYATRFTPLVNDSDEVTQTLKAYTTSCVEYCLSVAYGLDQKDTESQQHYQLFAQGKADFIAEATPRDVSSIKTIQINETVSGLEEDISTDLGDWWW